jgi:hypothetical protein
MEMLSDTFFLYFAYGLLIEAVYVKKKIIGLAYFALCIFLFATLRNFSYPAKADNSSDQPSRSQTTLTLDFIKGNTSLIEPCAFVPGSGGGRGP